MGFHADRPLRIDLVEKEWQWGGEEENMGAPSEKRVKVSRLALLNVLTPMCKKPCTPHYRFMC